jgi:acetate---CoA ligase (ADP-forming)
VHVSGRYHDSVNRLFAPRGVAVVGASRSGTGGTIVENFRRLGFGGQVICVNPKYEEVHGYPCVASMGEVPFEPDAVILAVGRNRVVPMLEAAAARGARSAVTFALGFAEIDEAGRALQQSLAGIARAADMAVIGPNCQGLISFTARAPLYMDSVHAYNPGRVALLAESGSIVTSLINNRRGIRWSHAVSSGNEAVTDAADIISYFVDNPDVDVICAQLEAIRRPEAFFAVCDRAREEGKPVVVFATGRTAEARAAATAHSGALALPHRLVESALRRHGVAPVESLDELLETAIALQSRRSPADGRLAVLTASGGHIELVHDNMIGTGLSIPAFTPETASDLSETLAPFLSPRNPLDWWGTPDPDESLPLILRKTVEDPNIDIALQVGDFTVGPTGDDARSGGALDAARKVQEERDELFVVLDGVGGAPSAADVEAALDDGILVLSGFHSGLRALGHLVDAHKPLPHPRAQAQLPAARHRWLQRGDHQVVGGADALDVLEAAGLDVVRRHAVGDVDEALSAAETLGYPVVVKIGDAEVSHKTENSGVIMGVPSSDELRAAVSRLLGQGARTILIEEQIDGGVEILLGIESRPPLGAFVLVGLGGIWTEILDDVQIRPIGLRAGEASEMIQSLRAYPLLNGARGQPVLSTSALAQALERLDDLAHVLGDELGSVDINPLIVLPDRAVAVDALLTATETGGSS